MSTHFNESLVVRHEDGKFAAHIHHEPSITLAPIPERLDLSGFDASFAAAPTYKKNAIVTARRTEHPEKLATVLADGTVETERVVPAGHWIITNPGGEQYAIDDEKFAKKYTQEGTPGTYRAAGEIRAIQSPVQGPITITAPWGEEQHGNEGCYLAAGVDEDGNPTADRYIIGEQEFADTYVPKTGSVEAA
jgi:hypothetical protein